MNAEIQAIGRYLLRAQSLAVYESVNGQAPPGGVAPPAKGIITLSKGTDVTIGHFAAEIEPQAISAMLSYVLVANRNFDAASSLQLGFAGFAEQLEKATGAWRAVSGGEISFGPGEAHLFRVAALP